MSERRLERRRVVFPSFLPFDATRLETDSRIIFWFLQKHQQVSQSSLLLSFRSRSVTDRVDFFIPRSLLQELMDLALIMCAYIHYIFMINTADLLLFFSSSSQLHDLPRSLLPFRNQRPLHPPKRSHLLPVRRHGFRNRRRILSISKRTTPTADEGSFGSSSQRSDDDFSEGKSGDAASDDRWVV